MTHKSSHIIIEFRKNIEAAEKALDKMKELLRQLEDEEGEDDSP